MKTLCKGHIPGAPLSACNGPLDIFKLMSENKLIDEHLSELLKNIERVDLETEVKYWTRLQGLDRRRLKTYPGEYGKEDYFKITDTVSKAMDRVILLNEKESNIRKEKKKLTKSKDQAILDALNHRDYLVKRIQEIIENYKKKIDNAFIEKVEILDSQLDNMETTKIMVIENTKSLSEEKTEDAQEKLENLLREKIDLDPLVNHNLEYSPDPQDISDFIKGYVSANKAVACKTVVRIAKHGLCQLVTYDIQGNEVKQGGAEITAELSDTIDSEEERVTCKIIDKENGKYDIKYKLFKKQYLHITLFGQLIKDRPIEIGPIPTLPLKAVTVVRRNERCRDLLGVAISSDNKIFVGDPNNSKVQVYSMDGIPQKSFNLNYNNNDEKKMKAKPRGLAFTREEHLVIADRGGNQVCVYDTKGGLVRRFGEGELTAPAGVAVSSDGHIHVADMGGNCLKTFTSEGEVVRAIGSFGDQTTCFSDPIGVAVNSKDQIIVSDHGNHRVQVFDSNGAFLFYCGSHGNGDGHLHYPRGVTVDQYDNIIVCDGYNNRVQMFGPSGIYIDRVDDQRDKIKAPHSITTTVSGSVLKLIVTESDSSFNHCMRVWSVEN